MTGGRLVLITGASSGIGRAAADAFVARGDRVIGTGRNAEALRALETAHGGAPRIATLVADVADAASMQAMTEQVLEHHGTPDVVVANAGIGLDARFVDTTDEAAASVFETNVFGTVRTVRPFLPAMVERGSGRVLLISSIVGKRGIPHYAMYSASKFALHGMADALRCELWGTGVTVGLVCPSTTKSEFQERLLRHGPGQRRVRPQISSAESVAAAIVRMAGSRRREVVLSSGGKLLWLADALAPGLVDRVLARALLRR